MDSVYVTEVVVGQTVVNCLSGAKYKVGKVEEADGGRIALYDTTGEKRNVSGRKVQYMIVGT
jgi:hypothetical protein